MPKNNLIKVKRIYCIGIKGVAVSGLALICRDMGLDVAGSDVEQEFITDRVLREQAIEVFEGFDPAHLDWNPDLVVVGASWDEENIEVREAKRRGIPIMNESDLRGELSRLKTTIAVTGAHGKTTTTSLLSHIFNLAGLKPSYLIGTAMIPDLGVNGHWDEGKHFIVEGDEYVKSRKNQTPKFLDLSPDTTIITNIEWEHVDVYHNVGEMEAVFEKLAVKTGSTVVACIDWPSVRNIIEGDSDKIETYGTRAGAEWRMTDFVQRVNYSTFKVTRHNRFYDEFELRLLGRFNALNAIACLIVALKYGVDIEVIREAFRTFSGLQRRLDTEVKKEILFIDDYGHHPTEVYETLHAIRDTYLNRKIICVFQPHTASRTRAFIGEFSKAFRDVDEVVIVDVFASAREGEDKNITRILFERVKKHHPGAYHFGGVDETIAKVKKMIRPRDIVVTMGAGDVYKIKEALMDQV